MSTKQTAKVTKTTKPATKPAQVVKPPVTTEPLAPTAAPDPVQPPVSLKQVISTPDKKSRSQSGVMLPKELLDELRRCATESGVSIRTFTIQAAYAAIQTHDQRAAEMAQVVVVDEAPQEVEEVTEE